MMPTGITANPHAAAVSATAAILFHAARDEYFVATQERAMRVHIIAALVPTKIATPANATPSGLVETCRTSSATSTAITAMTAPQRRLASRNPDTFSRFGGEANCETNNRRHKYNAPTTRNGKAIAKRPLAISSSRGSAVMTAELAKP
jgi:hypothetical protein